MSSSTAHRQRVDQFKRNGLQMIEWIQQFASIVEVIELMALYFSTDCKLQQQIVCHWMQPLCHGADTPLQTEIKQRFNVLLTTPIRLEIQTKSENRLHGIIYLFGTEHPTFSIPFDLLGVDFVVFACLLRLMSQGHMNEGRRAFGRSSCSSDNCTLTWSEFAFNHTLQQSICRAPFLISIIAYFAATSWAAAQLPPVVGAPPRNYSRATRVLLLGALTDSLSYINGGATSMQQNSPKSDVRMRCTWLDDAFVSDMYALRRLCKADATFNVKQLLELLGHQYKRIFRVDDTIKLQK